MTSVTWNDNSDNWDTSADWSDGQVPNSDDDVTIAQGSPYINTNVGTVNSVAVSSTLGISNGPLMSNGDITTLGALATTAGFTITSLGTVNIDAFAEQLGSTLTVGGSLTNAGNLAVGQSGAGTPAGPPTTVTIDGQLVNTGAIFVAGDDAVGHMSQTSVDVSGAAGFGTAGELTGNVRMFGDSLIQFASGAITQIGAGASLQLNAALSQVNIAGEAGPNSALTGLNTISGSFDLENGATLTTTTNLINSSGLTVDGGSGATGSALTIGGSLTNSGSLTVGNIGESGSSTLNVMGAAGLTNSGTIYISGATSSGGTVDVAGAAGFGTAGHLTGNVNLSGDALIEFASGGITQIDGSASLTLSGAQARIANASGTSSNSALTGLTTIAGRVALQNGASVTTNAGTNLTNTNGYGLGIISHATLNVGGALTNSGGITVGQLSTGNGGSLNIEGAANSSNTGGIAVLNNAEFTASVGVNFTNSNFFGLDQYNGNSGATATINGSLINTATLQIGNNAGSGTVLNGTGTLALTAGTATVDSSATVSVANLTIGGTGVLDLNAAASAITSAISFAPGTSATLQLESAAISSSGGTFGDSLANFSGGDVIDIRSLSYQNNTTPTYNAATGQITITEGSFTDTFTLTTPGTSMFVAKSDGNGGTEIVVCFAEGTRIRTVHGDVAIERLAVGDMVVTASGAHRAIRWIGHRRTDCRRHPWPSEVMPVRISAHAFALNQPARDLYVSPAHALAVEVVGEVLMPAIALVNGATIQQVNVPEVTYWHVELERHDVLLADNLPAESYLESGNRGVFAGNGVVRLNAVPDAKARARLPFCRPFHETGPQVKLMRARLAARARALGWTLRTDPFADLHLLADGVRIDAALQGRRATFTLPASAREVLLVSMATRPTDVSRAADARTLGVGIAGMEIVEADGAAREIPLDDPKLGVGFHPVERNGDRTWRWTAGRACLTAALPMRRTDPLELTIDLVGDAPPHWLAPTIRRNSAKAA